MSIGNRLRSVLHRVMGWVLGTKVQDYQNPDMIDAGWSGSMRTRLGNFYIGFVTRDGDRVYKF